MLAAIKAMMETNPSTSMAPKPIAFTSVSLLIILGVVPAAISEWKPEMAPQAMVMNMNGNSRAGDDRALAVTKAGHRRHLQIGGDKDNAERKHQDRADLHVGAEIIARAQQHPDRQHRRHESVHRHGRHQLVHATG